MLASSVAGVAAVFGMRWGRWCLVLAAWAGSASAVSPTQIFSLDYEGQINSAPVLATMTTQPKPQALQVDCQVARSGRCSVRAEVSATAGSISAGAYRAESDTMSLHDTRYSPGETLRYRFSLRLSEDWVVAPTSSIDILWQFKRFDSKPDMFVAAKGDALVLRIGDKAQIGVFKPLPVGRWLDVDMQVHWSIGADGWVNGEAKVAGENKVHAFRYAGPTTLNDKPRAAYLKWGLYKPGKTDGSIAFPLRRVWHDEIIVERLE